MTEYRYCAETVPFEDWSAMVCSREIVEGRCPQHGHARSLVDEKRTAEVAAAEARGRQQAIDALRDDERYGAWLSQIRPGDGRYWDMDRPGRQLADYLESISTPDGSVT